MQCQKLIHNTTLDNILSMEAQNVINGRPLMRDEQHVVSKVNYVNSLVADTKQELSTKASSVQAIKEKAAAKGRTFEEQLEFDARWVVNDKINRGVIDLGNFIEDEQRINTRRTIDDWVSCIEQELIEKPSSVQIIKEKAASNGRTFEEQLRADAQWIVNDRISNGIISIE